MLDNIKASIDPILKSDFESGEPIGIGAHLKGYMRKSLTTALQQSTKNKEQLSQQMTPSLTGCWAKLITLGT